MEIRDLNRCDGLAGDVYHMNYCRGFVLVVFDGEPSANNAIDFRGYGRLRENMANQQEGGKRKHQRLFHFVHDLSG